MRILVTGHKGFIGQNLVNSFKNEHELDYFEWNYQLPKISNYDWVIHLGAISSTTESDVEKIMSQNYDFSCWILGECISNKVNLQYASSASVYGLNTEFSESSKPDPRSPYAWSKYLFDRQVQKNMPYNIIVQGFRYFNVYGSHEDHKGDQASPYHKFTQQARVSGVIKLFENSENYLRDFVPVETVVDTHKKFLSIPESGIFNVGTGVAKSFLQVAKEVQEKYSADIRYISMPEKLQSQYQTYTCADMTQVQNLYKKYNLV